MKSKVIVYRIFMVAAMCLFALYPASLLGEKVNFSLERIDEEVQELMEKGDIPGLSLIIVDGPDRVFIQNYGYADLAEKKPVTKETVFELGSCSKAFTALAALRCEKEGFLDLDQPVSSYLTWFQAFYKGKKTEITLHQLLGHTSGIPFKSISLIPESTAPDALQKTAEVLRGVELVNKPGTHFEYATINYDVVAAVIEKVTGMSFEQYMAGKIFKPLGLSSTLAGVDKNNPPANMSKGYRTGFFRAFEFDAPVFRGNTAAGYILSNGEDVSRWLQIQLGYVSTELEDLVLESHRTDESILFNPTNLSYYTDGWIVFMKHLRRIEHAGDNPNFSTFISLNPKDKKGVAVLANNRSVFTPIIARTVLQHLEGKDFLDTGGIEDTMDKGASVVSGMLTLFILAVLFFMLSIFYDLLKGRRKFQLPGIKQIGKYFFQALLFVPFVIGVLLVPRSLAGVSMDTAMLFSPVSFTVAVYLVFVAMGMCLLAMLLSMLFPQENKYLRSLPLVLVLSMLSGGANAVVIFLITSSVFNRGELFYHLYNFALAFFIYILGRKMVQTKLIRITFDIVYDMRLKLLEKIFYTSYQKFEKIDRGRVFATLNNDTGRIGGSANILVQLITSAITAVGAFLYLATIAFWATALTLLIVGVIATLYSVVTRRTQVFFEEARDTQNVYMRLLNGMADGFKQLSLQYNKKKEYKSEIADTVDEFRSKTSTAMIKFVNAFLIGESLLIIILGTVGYGIPRLFPNIAPLTLMAFIMVLLYLIGPINGILNAIPNIMQLRVAWNRVKEFIDDVPANMDPKEIEALNHDNPGVVESIEARNLTFVYKNEEGEENFSIGPLDFEAKKGEIVFIIGGNGSGKTTLAKLLTGLYTPDSGVIKVDGKEINNYELGEFYSVVFGDHFLFEKLYNVDMEDREDQVADYLETLNLDDKVAMDGNAFSTIELSGGQRKRLSLLQCYLEDRPIFLFDEIAADQDPVFRKFFYRELLLRMKAQGKIVIAITHDDHYFDVADKVVKLDMGKVDVFSDEEKAGLSVTH